jgi:hypothetical protein
MEPRESYRVAFVACLPRRRRAKRSPGPANAASQPCPGSRGVVWQPHPELRAEDPEPESDATSPSPPASLGPPSICGPEASLPESPSSGCASDRASAAVPLSSDAAAPASDCASWADASPAPDSATPPSSGPASAPASNAPPASPAPASGAPPSTFAPASTVGASHVPALHVPPFPQAMPSCSGTPGSHVSLVPAQSGAAAHAPASPPTVFGGR